MNLPATRPPRALGLASQPTLRLALGYKDPAKKGAPVKTDYFVAKEGRDGEYAAAARKFTQVYGDKPRAIDIMLPISIGQALDVRYRAFKGNPTDDDGGVMVAVGNTNWALVGVRGGPDTLTVFDQDGTVRDVDITGEDDPICKELGVALYTTFKFSIPTVLGAAGVCEITSKGRKTTDNLFERLVTLYSWFGANAPFAIRPKLVLRPATGRPVVKGKRIKSSFYALDIYVPESLDEMADRLRGFRAELPGGSPTAALYGSDRPAIEAAAQSLTSAPSTDATPEPSIKGDSDGGQQAEEAKASTESGCAGAASSVPDSEPEPSLEPEPSEQASSFKAPPDIADSVAEIARVSAVKVPPESDESAGLTLQEVKEKGAVGERWIAWQLKTRKFESIADDVERFVELVMPDLWKRYQADKKKAKKANKK
jgi:hypothetical protein